VSTLILGILSDTHGRRARTAVALRLLQQVGAEAFVHCGDVGGADVLDELAGLRAWAVYGNMDQPDAAALAASSAPGLTIARQGPLRIELDGRMLAVFHGHEAEFGRWLAALEHRATLPAKVAPCDYILHGHTHVPRDLRIGSVRLVNPGALERAAVHTVATLDLRSDTLEFWQVDDGVSARRPVPYKLARR
jgi:putative phosphoesterase